MDSLSGSATFTWDNNGRWIGESIYVRSGEVTDINDILAGINIWYDQHYNYNFSSGDSGTCDTNAVCGDYTGIIHV